MKKLILIVALLFAMPSFAQTRTVNITWTASTSSVSNYVIYSCTVPSGNTSCTPNVTGTPIGTVTTTSFTTSETTGVAYGFSVVAEAQPCTSTSSLTVPCGSAPPDTLTYVPVPPVVAGETNLVIVVP